MKLKVLEQLEKAGYLADCAQLSVTGEAVRFVLFPSAVDRLRADKEFASGPGYLYHKDIGDHLLDFRSFEGSFGKGSLQIVVDATSGEAYADIDKHNPYQDVVGFLTHNLGEVVPHTVRDWWRKLSGKV